MKLTTDKVSEIRACYGVYAAADVARAYGVHRSNIVRIWKEEHYKDVRPAPEAPNLPTRNRAGDLMEDIKILLNRGMTVPEVAEKLGISRSSVYALGRGIFL